MNEFSRYIRDLSVSLHTTAILYLGCSNQEDLAEFPSDTNVCGIADGIEKFTRKYPSFKFTQGSVDATPYADGTFDFVFTHKLFSCTNKDVKNVLNEMYRISSKYIVNFELKESENKDVSDTLYNKWLEFGVKIISNVQMHKDIDSEQCQFTLVRKIN